MNQGFYINTSEPLWKRRNSLFLTATCCTGMGSSLNRYPNMTHEFGSINPVQRKRGKIYVILNRVISFLIKFGCLGFYTVSTVLQLFNGDGPQIHVSWAIFDQYLTSPLS